MMVWFSINLHPHNPDGNTLRFLIYLLNPYALGIPLGVRERSRIMSAVEGGRES